MDADDRDIYRFTIGALGAIALKDGDIHVPNDGKTVGVGQPREAVAALLAEAGLPTETIDFSIQPLVVRDGPRTLLFDAGAASASFARAGRLPRSLRAAGISESEITDVFISHAHPDHVGGLETASGALAFPNARIHISVPEWTAMQDDAEQAPLVAVIATKGSLSRRTPRSCRVSPPSQCEVTRQDTRPIESPRAPSSCSSAAHRGARARATGYKMRA